MASAGLAWSLANGITEAQYYENLRKSLITATENGVGDKTIADEMKKYGISAEDLAKATGVKTEVVQSKIDAVTTPGLLEPEVDTPTPPVVTAPVVTAPVVTTPAVTAPVVRLPTTPITNNSPGLLTPTTPVTPPVVTPPVVAAPVVPPVVRLPTTPITNNSPGLLTTTTPAVTPPVTAGGGGLLTTTTPTRSARDQTLFDFFTDNQKKYDLGTFKTELDKLGYTAEDVARVTGTPLAEVKRQYELAVSTPTTPLKPYVAPVTPVTPATPVTPVAPPVVTPPVVTKPVTPTTPTRSAGLTWSLNNGLSEAQ